ncbi:MAG: hypothetical protein HQ500_06685 [Flavobacteriales bacterium]|nr:hypothetical protein [Flavobacteriales bacterium]
MKNKLLFIAAIFMATGSMAQIHFNTTPGSGGTVDRRKEHHVWADGSSIMVINGRQAFQWKKGQNPNRIVRAGDHIKIVGMPDSLDRVQFGVFYDREWVFRVDTLTSTSVSWTYTVEEDPVYKRKNSGMAGLLILGVLDAIAK